MGRTNKQFSQGNKKIKCLGNCGRELVLTSHNFFKSNNPEFVKYEGFSPICKQCSREMIFNNDNTVNLDNFKKVLKYLDKPFIRSIFEEMLIDGFTLGDYTSRLNFGQYRTMGYKDSEDGEVNTISNGKQLINKIIENKYQVSDEELLEFQTRWGDGFDTKDYVYLEDQYKDLCNNYRSDDNYAMQLIFEEASHTRLTIKRKREKGEDVNKELKTLQDLLASANIKPNQETSANNIEKGSLGMFIKKIEEEEPIPRWEEDLGKEDKIKQYILTFFFGNLAKVLNIKNPWQEEFENEMKQYTVDNTVIAEEDKNEDLLGDI